MSVDTGTRLMSTRVMPATPAREEYVPRHLAPEPEPAVEVVEVVEPARSTPVPVRPVASVYGRVSDTPARRIVRRVTAWVTA